MQRRKWVDSGIVEELDHRQIRFLQKVEDAIRYYYTHLYGRSSKHKYPLSLAKLMRMCNRSSYAITLALRYLANTIPENSNDEPTVYYCRIPSTRRPYKRVYRIFYRKNG